jgi:hypothetical protein
MGPTADNPAGERRSRPAQDEAHVRDVLLALGGSTEELDQPNDGSARDASLGSRLEAYTRLARNRPAPAPAAPEPTPVAAEPAVPKPARARRRRRRPVVGGTIHRATPAVAGVALRLVHFSVHTAKLVAAALVRGARILAPRLRHTATLVAAALVRGARILAPRLRHAVSAGAAGLGAALVGVRTALKRPERRPEQEHVAVRVSQRVLQWSEHDAVDVAAVDVPDAEADVAVFEAPPADEDSSRRWTPGAGSALLSLLAVVLAGASFSLVLTHRADGDRQAQAQPVTTQPPRPVPLRTSYSDPRGYAAAMTRFALTSGRTELDGTPVCVQGGTYDRWTCRARGRPALGAYSGRRLTFRCSPHSAPQPGGQPAVMIDCRPENPPPLTT